jgi:ankyrin repeat protein
MSRYMLIFIILNCIFLLPSCGASKSNSPPGPAVYTEMHSAAAIGDIEKIKSLIKSGLNVNARSHVDETPLHFAALNNHPECVEFLAAIAEVNAQDKSGQTPLLLSIDSCDISEKTVRALVAAGANVNIGNDNGISPLHMAAGHGSPHCAEILLQAGASVNAVDKDGDTPLLIASKCGHDECVSILLKHKADISIKDSKGWSALICSANAGYPKVVDVLLAAGAKEETWTPLHIAVIQNKLEEVKKYLDSTTNRDDLNKKDQYGRSPLIWAIILADDKVIATLVEAGADLNVTDRESQTVAHFAARIGNLDMLKQLADANIDLQAKDINANTPLHLAARSLDPDVITFLVGSKVAIDPRNNIHDTPLLLAIGSIKGMHGLTKEGIEAIQILLDNGADVLARNIQGEAPSDLAFGLPMKILQMIQDKAACAEEEHLRKILEYYASEKELPRAIVPSTPKALLQRLIRSFFMNDRETFLSCCAGTSQEIDAMASLFDCGCTWFDFRAAMIKERGRDAWIEYRSGSGVQFRLITAFFDENNLGDTSLELLGDNKASWRGAFYDIDQAILIKKKDTWFIDVRSLIAEPRKPDDVCKVFKSMTNLLHDAMPEINQPDISIKEIGDKLGKKFFGVTTTE